MSYYTRAFCTASNLPTLSTILDWLKKHGFHVTMDPDSTEDLTSRLWEQAVIIYRPGKLPILVECNRDDESKDSLMLREIDEFLDSIGQLVYHFRSKKLYIT